MIIDGHSHVILPLEEHIHLMDTAGVDMTVLFSTITHPETAGSFIGIRNEMQRLNEIIGGKSNVSVQARLKGNKELTDAIAAYPSRYIGFGSVPLTLSEREINDYVEKEVVGKGLIGLGEFTLPSGAVNLLRPVFSASVCFGNLPLWVHAFHPLVMKDIKEIAQYAKSFPATPVILGHLGGSNWLETIELVKETPNLYLDISAYFSTLVLKLAINEIPYKCIFGVDMPYGDLQLSLDAVRKLSDDHQIAAAILGDNIAALLNL